ncbi:hypothetical protein GKU49_22120 [Salmonella enterica]|nr:hypothetical protein [Salmonella enterica]EDD3986844.1 hypothetical protein [Salmonella enterica subsp. enterica serovar Panama]EAT3611508.1 hypothetical protein [Salmonella enterica]EAW4992940.1 hypothetical protein [Salmonella enterica]EEF5928886.1 hypothetical protein [Salmonella enterica]
MRLTVGDIKFSESGYVSTNVKVEPGEYPCIPLSICTMHVSVPLVEGKTLEQYKDEILGEARERIDNMYKEIICGGQNAESLCEDFMGKSGDEGIWSMGFRIEDREGRLVVCDENGESEPTREHRDKIIERAISMLRSGNRNMLKRLGRAMGLLQVAADIEAMNQLCGSARREHVLKDFDNPPFKKVPDDWISPGVEYLTKRLGEEAREDELIISSIYGIARKAVKDVINSRECRGR